eukprot:TRINITY_DN15099_c0_g1::TRINITY_DN15099_c0_g1_i1::g.25034::m.25034 TRINITY_DN15099_c0_g1::TRINITY_DN15099_c0_g1_i1::g.25034  ORF type:complete len:472 (-),score=59.24,sp/Q9TV36/FBN1_PIG/45.10/5e-06,EGF_3/PF12947.2/3.2e-08,EGF_3/PF12947.2/3.7e-08,Laminin_G_3/PF13385.1/2e-14,Laminin_G_3/PF13385.1/1.5e+03,EGF_CA/PF07645.10/1e+03,EGF_CA/PF07645.10/5.5e-10,EGF/PF00008.22/0.12,EGF/PF00008.22/0.00048,EGF/PF00008.22/1.7e+03,EGF_MSP1_1/PF12946.2/6.3e+02,EGF_MSP1_1/PF12946.2/0.0071,cEGF/PF12662.2/1.9,cEGF/
MAYLYQAFLYLSIFVLFCAFAEARIPHISACLTVATGSRVADSYSTGTSGFSYSFWYKPTTGFTSQLRSILRRPGTSQLPVPAIYMNDDDNSLAVYVATSSDSTRSITTQTQLTIGQWNHVVLSVSSDTSARVYVNGGIDGYFPSDGSEIPESGSLYVSEVGSASAGGTVAALKYYDYPLVAADVSELYVAADYELCTGPCATNTHGCHSEATCRAVWNGIATVAQCTCNDGYYGTGTSCTKCSDLEFYPAYEYYKWEIVRNRYTSGSVEVAELYLYTDSAYAASAIDGSAWQVESFGWNPTDYTDSPGYTMTGQQLFGGDLTKLFRDDSFLDNDYNVTVLITLTTPIRIAAYEFITGTDENADPMTWTLYGSHDALAWKVVDFRADQDVPNARWTSSGVFHTCDTSNECTSGTHNCHSKASCLNTNGSYECSCNSGYAGNGAVCFRSELPAFACSTVSQGGSLCKIKTES